MRRLHFFELSASPIASFVEQSARFFTVQLVVARLEVALTTHFGIGSALDGAGFGWHLTF